MILPFRRTVVVAAVTFSFLAAANWLSVTDGPMTDLAAGSLVPIFSPALDGPVFDIEFTNNADSIANIIELLEGSHIVLDGKQHVRMGLKFVGSSKLAAGQTRSFDIDLGSYLAGWEKQGYSKKLNRWRWKAPLVSGEHSLELHFGGKQYGPVTFRWDGDLPLLYE